MARQSSALPAVLIVGFVAVVCLFPFLLVVITSFTAESAILADGYRLIPAELSIAAYREIFTFGGGDPGYVGGSFLLNSYLVSILATTVGTVGALVITYLAAFALANRRLRYRNALSLFFFVPMVFSGGVVPWYIMCHRLGLVENLAALLVPNLIFSPFNMFLARNYLLSLPNSLRESAMVDGANAFQIAISIYLPVAVPVIAAISLFYGLAYWNDWWNAIMLVTQKQLYPLQYMLFRLQSDVSAIRNLRDMGIMTTQEVLPDESLKMATVVVTIGPIVFLYPFLQRYFVRGLVIGAVKG